MISLPFIIVFSRFGREVVSMRSICTKTRWYDFNSSQRLQVYATIENISCAPELSQRSKTFSHRRCGWHLIAYPLCSFLVEKKKCVARKISTRGALQRLFCRAHHFDVLKMLDSLRWIQAIRNQHADSSLICTLFWVWFIVNFLCAYILNLENSRRKAKCFSNFLSIFDLRDVGTERSILSAFHVVGHCVCAVFALPAIFWLFSFL